MLASVKLTSAIQNRVIARSFPEVASVIYNPVECEHGHNKVISGASLRLCSGGGVIFAQSTVVMPPKLPPEFIAPFVRAHIHCLENQAPGRMRKYGKYWKTGALAPQTGAQS
jgi:hypothetical protein